MNAQWTKSPNPRPARPMPSAAAVVAKSVVAVALIAAIGWIGIRMNRDIAPEDPAVYAAGAAVGTVIPEDPAAAHRRQVFEERRTRFDANRSPAQLADGADRSPAKH